MIFQTAPKPNKYHAIKQTVYGHEFDSRKEAGWYLILKEKEAKKEISDLKIQVPFELQPAYDVPIKGKNKKQTIRAILYVADFVFFDNKEKRLRVLDAKGMKTPVYLIKKKMFEYIHKSGNLRIEEQI